MTEEEFAVKLKALDGSRSSPKWNAYVVALRAKYGLPEVTPETFSWLDPEDPEEIPAQAEIAPDDSGIITESIEMKSQESLPVPTDGYDNDDGDHSLIKGEIAKCVDGIWSVKNGAPFPPKTQLLALSTATALQHWENKLPVEVILKVPGKPFPNADDLNATIPEEKWEKGIDDQPRRPWQKVEIVYLLNVQTASLFTHINHTVGTSIAVRHLRDKVKMMRMLRGNKVVPIVELDSKPMPTKRGQKIRPHFEIVDWRDFDSLSAGTPVAATTTVPALGKPVASPTTAEIMNDEMPPWDDVDADEDQYFIADGKPAMFIDDK